ncbi:MAG: hypothetical protein R6U16_13720 [Desulfotignum sp.]
MPATSQHNEQALEVPDFNVEESDRLGENPGRFLVEELTVDDGDGTTGDLMLARLCIDGDRYLLFRHIAPVPPLPGLIGHLNMQQGIAVTQPVPTGFHRNDKPVLFWNFSGKRIKHGTRRIILFQQGFFRFLLHQTDMNLPETCAGVLDIQGQCHSVLEIQ